MKRLLDARFLGRRLGLTGIATAITLSVSMSQALANEEASDPSDTNAQAPVALVDTFLDCYETEFDCTNARLNYQAAYPNYAFFCENYFACGVSGNGEANALFYAPK